jgi:hypothetical protein
MPAPANPKIYHIVHVDRLASIVRDGSLWCDAEVVRRGLSGTTIGMSSIKQRRLSLPVHCHAGDHVGDYVPFYFCPRSIMLYLLYRGNHSELTYREGQDSIVHLEADLHQAVNWAEANGRRWAFSLSNAAAVYTEFRDDLDDLHEINWSAVQATDFRSADVKEGKQAEFLMHLLFPWTLIQRVGVRSRAVLQMVLEAIAGATHQPRVEIITPWYY